MYGFVDLNFLYKWQEEPWGYMYIISRIAKMWKAEVSCIDKLNIRQEWTSQKIIWIYPEEEKPRGKF